MQTKALPSERDYLAPDGSEIRLLLDLEGGKGGLAHCVLPARHVSGATANQTVGEIWYCVQGIGQVWLKSSDALEGSIVDVVPGTCLTIEAGTHFQFRNTGAEPLAIIIVTIPSWPGPEESLKVKGHWREREEVHMSHGNLGDLGDLDLSTLQQYLPSVNFPASKEEVASSAESNGAPPELVQEIRNAPTEHFNSPDEVLYSLPGDWTGGGPRDL